MDPIKIQVVGNKPIHKYPAALYFPLLAGLGLNRQLELIPTKVSNVKELKDKVFLTSCSATHGAAIDPAFGLESFELAKRLYTYPRNYSQTVTSVFFETPGSYDACYSYYDATYWAFLEHRNFLKPKETVCENVLFVGAAEFTYLYPSGFSLTPSELDQILGTNLIERNIVQNMVLIVEAWNNK